MVWFGLLPNQAIHTGIGQLIWPDNWRLMLGCGLILPVLVLMLFITYGFIGLEYVSMELDDPYGNDPNDFPGK